MHAYIHTYIHNHARPPHTPYMYYVYIYIYINICIYLYTHMYLYVYIFINTHLDSDTYMYACMCGQIGICSVKTITVSDAFSVPIYVLSPYTYIYTQAHTHLFTCSLHFQLVFRLSEMVSREASKGFFHLGGEYIMGGLADGLSPLVAFCDACSEKGGMFLV